MQLLFQKEADLDSLYSICQIDNWYNLQKLGKFGDISHIGRTQIASLSNNFRQANF